jgi:hypothetical protein
MRDPRPDIATLHQLAKKARESMTSGEIAHAARIARANMRLVAKLKEEFRRQCRDDAADAYLNKCRRLRPMAEV